VGENMNLKKLLICIVCVQMIFCAKGTSQLTSLEISQLKREVLERLPSFLGWCSGEKALQFIDLVLTERPLIWVEIGVFGGASLFPVASVFKILGEGTVIGIDPWDKIECIKYFDPIKDRIHLHWWGNLDLNHICMSYLTQMCQYGLDRYCTTIRETSEKAIHLIERIDVLHIDGNHSQYCSTQDVLLYLPKVREGGFIWMNDVGAEERQEALSILLLMCDVVKTIDNGNCVLFKKRD
jgi:hypothetical protein